MSCPRILLAIALSALGLALSSGCAASAPAAVKPPPSAEASADARPAPARAEELWIIAKPQFNDLTSRPPAGDAPAAGTLLAQLPNAPAQLPLPLRHTDVRADIAGYVASVSVTQQFHNPFAAKIEAVYAFPLPHAAAVNEFLITVGDRKIRGVIRERAEAERLYTAARAQGHLASLFTQQHPDRFTQAVANIDPGQRIDVQLTYFHALSYDNGAYEWRFPMTEGSQLNSPTGLLTSGSKISLAVHVDALARIEHLETPSHRTISHTDNTRADVTLAAADAIPNRDFILRYRVATAPARLAHFDRRRADLALLALDNHPVLSRLPGWGWLGETYALANNLVSRRAGFLAVDATRSH
jgi:hypothetical protein